jgi:4-hydroxy-tetrahydrodipicolinate synthase
MTEAFTLISAIGTPLTDDGERLHVVGLEAQIHDQWSGGMTGLLVGGTMGMMQLLADETYEDLVDHSIRLGRGRGEVLVGVGDAGLTRTLARVRLLNEKKADGVVALAPYFLKFGQIELVDYYTAIADASRHPLYLYDLPVLTGTKLSLETVATLAGHRNIRGIKCSCDFTWTRQLIDMDLPDFRVIVAQAEIIDVLFRAGVRSHLDGIFAAAPHWVGDIARAATRGDWDSAADAQRKLIALLKVVRDRGVMPAFTVIMNARGIPGNFAPRPHRPLDPRAVEAILAEPIVQELLAAAPAAAR